MEIIIPLPQCSSVSTYQQLRSYLKQLELAVHHAQKSVESAEKEGVEVSEDCFVIFQHPSLTSSFLSDSKEESAETETAKTVLENFDDTYYGELQNVELKINLA